MIQVPCTKALEHPGASLGGVGRTTSSSGRSADRVDTGVEFPSREKELSLIRLIFKKNIYRSELIEPVSPQATQLGINFYCFHNPQLEKHLLEGPDEGHSTGEGK